MSKIYILGHENPDVDSIVSGYLLEKYLSMKGMNTEFIIPDEQIDLETINICLKYGLDAQKYQKPLSKGFNQYILVDHNDREVNGEIIAIFDHHPSFKENNIKHYYNKRISSTTCLICQNNEDMFSDDDLKLAFVAAMVDTASFHSTKGRKIDNEWIKKICNQREINYDEIYQSGLMLTNLNNLNLAALHGLKKYHIDDIVMEASYIQIADVNQNVIDNMLDYLKDYRNKKKLTCFVFIVHDMVKFASKVYILFHNNIKIKNYKTYVSRGDQIIPDLLKLIKKHDIL